MASLEKLVNVGASTLVFLSGCEPYMDTQELEEVLISPETPTVRDDLACSVKDRSEDIFDFYWFVNSEFRAANSLTSSGFFHGGMAQKGDYVECSVWYPVSSFLYVGGYVGYVEVGGEVGRVGVTILGK